MSTGRRIVCLIATMTLLSCGRTGPAAALPSEPVARALAAKPHRLAVVFWPQLSGCNSCDQMISAVISEWEAAPDAQMAVVTVVPETGKAADPWLPGTVVRIGADDYKRLAGNAPLPRVEIRNAGGAVLMARSVPNYGSQAELLTEEMLAARSFTAPVEVAAAAGKAPR